jgi:hypothetical protein
MDIDVFEPQELDTVFRALRTALAPDQSPDVRQRRFLATYARITGYPLADPVPQAIDASEVRIAGAHRRKRLIQLVAIAVLFGRPLKPGSVGFLKELSRQLATHDGVIDVIDAVQQGRHVRVRMLAMRRALRAFIKEAWQAGGIAGVLRFAGAMFLKARGNRSKLSDYKRLGLLPEGTLGREYWKHMTEVGFGFPGEPGGIADTVAYHDVAHVLAGHDTTPLGEIQQGSFQGGNRREDGFLFIQFVILHFHHGIRVTPMAPPEVGYFDPEKVLWAIHRGAKCPVDVTHQWDYWPLMALPLQEARAQCGLLPGLPMANALRRAA